MNASKSASQRRNKSTNVRFIKPLIRAAGWVAPRSVDRWAAELWGRPTRPHPPREPSVPWLTARRFTVTDGPWELAAWEWGSGPTVLLVHGWSGYAAQLQAFIAPLVANGLHVVAVDLPSHGQSSGKIATLPDLASAVGVLGRRFGPLHGVIAHSLGAAATVVALANGMHSKRNVLIAPPAEMAYFAQAFARYIGLPPKRVEGMFQFIREWIGRDLEAFNLRTLAPALEGAALVMHDLADREVPFDHGRALAEAWPGATLNVLEGMGHRGALKDPAALAQAIRFIVGEEALTEARPVEREVPLAG